MTSEVDAYSWYRPGSCTVKHTMELVATRDVTGTVPPSAPRLDTDAYKAAYATCVPLADAYLGGDFRDSWFQVMVRMPNDAQWQAGNHTYTCELIGADAVALSFPLKGDLAGARKSAIGCVGITGSNPDKYGFWTDGNITDPVACTSPHNAEYVGSAYAADTPRLPDDSDPVVDTYVTRCGDLAGAFLGVPVKQIQRSRDLGVAGFWPRNDVWDTGEHVMRCYLEVVPSKTVSASLKARRTTTIK